MLKIQHLFLHITLYIVYYAMHTTLDLEKPVHKIL